MNHTTDRAGEEKQNRAGRHTSRATAIIDENRQRLIVRMRSNNPIDLSNSTDNRSYILGSFEGSSDKKFGADAV